MIRKTLLGAAVAVLAGTALAPAAVSAAPPTAGPSFAEVLDVKSVNNGKKAIVTARYRCATATHLWVSVKQTADGTRSGALTEEGSSQAAATWVQQHPGNFRCDGKERTGRFLVDQKEPAPWNPAMLLGKGALVDGEAWVQFCLTEEAETGEFVYALGWEQVN